MAQLNTADPDLCCGVALNAALLAGLLDDTDTWVHEACGCEWHAVMVGEIRHWSPQPLMEIFK